MATTNIVIDCRKLDNQTKVLFRKITMIYEYDATLDKCPLPLVKLRVILKKMVDNDSCIIRLADNGSKSDIPRLLTQQHYPYVVKRLIDEVVELHINNRE